MCSSLPICYLCWQQFEICKVVLYGSAKPLLCLAQIKQELEYNAPIQTVFIVYEDFMYYKDHIYENTSVNNLVYKLSRSLGLISREMDWKMIFRIKFRECLIDKNTNSDIDSKFKIIIDK